MNSKNGRLKKGAVWESDVGFGLSRRGYANNTPKRDGADADGPRKWPMQKVDPRKLPELVDREAELPPCGYRLGPQSVF